MIKIKVHSMVDVITNSSTVIYTYQNSTGQAKELVQEVLTLSGITDKTPDDIFWYGEFYSDFVDVLENYIDDLDDEDLKTEGLQEYLDLDCKGQEKWAEDYIAAVMRKEKDKPQWMERTDDFVDQWEPDIALYMIPKDEKYAVLGEKIKKLLGSVNADGGVDG